MGRVTLEWRKRSVMRPLSNGLSHISFDISCFGNLSWTYSAKLWLFAPCGCNSSSDLKLGEHVLPVCNNLHLNSLDLFRTDPLNQLFSTLRWTATSFRWSLTVCLQLDVQWLEKVREQFGVFSISAQICHKVWQGNDRTYRSRSTEWLQQNKICLVERPS